MRLLFKWVCKLFASIATNGGTQVTAVCGARVKFFFFKTNIKALDILYRYILLVVYILVKCKYNFPTVKTWSIWGKIKIYCFRIHFWVQQTCHKSEVVNLMIINDDAKPKRRRFKCCVVFTWQWCMSNLLYEFCDVSNLNVFVVSRQDVTKYFNCGFVTGPWLLINPNGI